MALSHKKRFPPLPYCFHPALVAREKGCCALAVFMSMSSLAALSPSSSSASLVARTSLRIPGRRGTTPTHRRSIITMRATTTEEEEGADIKKPTVLIAGAGVIGASIAYHLALRGVKATLYDQVGPGCAASGKAGGFLGKGGGGGVGRGEGASSGRRFWFVVLCHHLYQNATFLMRLYTMNEKNPASQRWPGATGAPWVP